MSLEQFQKQGYLNIETFRKSGQGVKTPVWFTQDGDSLHIWTQADSGKAKRVRNNGAVNIAPCTASGDLLGKWISAHAQADDSPTAVQRVRNLMSKKYGIMFYIFGFVGRLRGGSKYTAIKIQV
jgi:hypothetical protein